MKGKFLLPILFLFVCLQIMRPNTNNSVAETKTDYTHYINVPDSIKYILKRSCYDCHSNHTVYPWYSHVNPVGFWLNNHIKEGKEIFNFSDFSMYSKKQLDSLLQKISEGTAKREVPLKGYLIMHKNARLSEEEIEAITTWTKTEREKLSAQYMNFNNL